MRSYVSSIQRAAAALAAAKIELDRAVARQQKRCQHLDLIECDYRPSRFGGVADAPMRACCTCGMSEEGWGPGYVVLKGRAVMTDRDEVYRRRLGVKIWDAQKGPLLRSEVTVSQLVDREFGAAAADESGVPVVGASGSDLEAVGGFRFDQHAGWQQVAAEYASEPDVTTLYRKRNAGVGGSDA